MPVFPFLMFTGNASEALEFYSKHLADSSIVEMKTYGDDAAPEMKGQVERAEFEVQGLNIRVIDSPAVHDFTFTPATSFFIDCDDSETVDRLATVFSEGGSVLMPLDSYPFSERYAWVTDKFGVSWQFGLAIAG